MMEYSAINEIHHSRIEQIERNPELCFKHSTRITHSMPKNLITSLVIFLFRAGLNYFLFSLFATQPIAAEPKTTIVPIMSFVEVG